MSAAPRGTRGGAAARAYRDRAVTPEPVRPRPRRLRLAAVAGALGIVTAAGAFLVASPASAAPQAPAATPSPTATPRPVGLALAVDLAKATVLTLPANDGLRDRATFRVLSGKPGLVDVDAVRGTKTVHLATRVSLLATSTGWSKTVAVKVTGLKAGKWRIRAERSSDPTVSTRSGTFTVGTGAPVHVAVRPDVRTLYPYKDGTLDSTLVTVVAKDETGAVVPVTGSVRIDGGKQHVTKRLGAAGTARLGITALPLGAATVTASVKNASGTAVRRTAITLAPTAVGSARIARSSDTVQPVVDGLLDSVVLTTTGAASGGSPAKVSGTLTVTRGKTVAATFAVKDGKQHAFTWNGRVNGVVVPGTYTATLTLKGPQGLATTRTKTLLVTKAHLPYAVRDMFTVAAGNQQGLAVRNGTFYVGYDIGNGQSQIQRYDGMGMATGTLGPLPIEHVAELAYSTTTDRIYAANGGAKTLTKVYAIDPVWDADNPPADPSTAITQTFDLSALGYNGMVAVDDANKRLLVFASAAASSGWTVSSVTMTDTPVLDANGVQETNDDGSPKVVPAGTVTATVPISISGVPQGIDLVGQQLWVYTSIGKVNHVAKYDLSASSLITAAAASGASDLYWQGEGEGMATVQASDTNDGLPAWIYVGAHDPAKGALNHIGELVPVTDND